MKTKLTFGIIMICVLALCLQSNTRPAAIDFILAHPDSHEVLSREEQIQDIYSWIIKHPNDNDAWKSLHIYRSHSDAGLTLMFMRDSYKALEQSPHLFWRRYENGDEKALFRMIDAFQHDPTSFGENVIAVNKGLKKCLSYLSDQMSILAHDRQRYVKIYYCNTIMYSMYLEWTALYKDILAQQADNGEQPEAARRI